MVWLTVIIAMILQASFMHPFGIALYNLRSVAPASVRTLDIYLGAIPFLVLQLLMVAVLVAFPGLARHENSAPHLTDKEVEEALKPPPEATLPAAQASDPAAPK